MKHKVVVILEVEADTLEEANDEVNDLLYNGPLPKGSYHVVLNFEHDNAGQRVLYLPPEDGGGADAEDQD